MKIGIDCRLWNETGVGRYIRNLVNEIGEIDKSNEYILFFRKEAFETFALPSKHFQKRLSDVRWHSFDEQFTFKKIIEKEKVDLMHFPYFSYPVGYKGKFVITIHDLIINHFPTGQASTLSSPLYFLKHIGYQFVLKNAINHAKKVITVSGATKQEIIDHYMPGPEKVLVTLEGIDRSFEKEKPEKVDAPEKYFLYVGNVYPHKNATRLVEAFKEMQKIHNDAHLIFVGKEDYFSKKLEKEVEKEKVSNVLFFRNITDAQLSYLYQHAIALVAPSLMEGFGLPALEAMAHSCLVLCSEIPSFLEVCGDTALYFDPYNREDIANALEVAYKREIDHILERKKQGILRAKKFSWKEMAQQTVKIYEQSAL